jgi:hypothetical protein
MGINTINPGHGQAAQSVYKKDTGKDSSKTKKEESVEKTSLTDKITISSEVHDITNKADVVSKLISSNPVAAVSALKNIEPEKIKSLLSAA